MNFLLLVEVLSCLGSWVNAHDIALLSVESHASFLCSLFQTRQVVLKQDVVFSIFFRIKFPGPYNLILFLFIYCLPKTTMLIQSPDQEEH